MNVAIYIRVSTHYQIDKDSLPMQRGDLTNYCKYVLCTDNYEIFEDAGYSAKNTDRPAFQNMMDRMRKHEFTHILVWKIDRISRNLLDFCDIYEELKKYDVTFISKNEQFDTSTAMGEAMLKIILVFAELERKVTAERVTAVMVDRANKGLWNGAPVPLGYRWDNDKKFPMVDTDEAPVVEFIYNTYLETCSTTAVKDALNTNGIKTKKGATWTTKTISDIIRNPFYKGTYRYNFRSSGRGKKKKENEWVLVENSHEGIISEDIWSECNKIMDTNAKRNNAAGFRAKGKTHVFAGLIKCGECGNTMYSKCDKPHNDGFVPSMYTCSGRYNHLGCSQKTISENYIGTFIFNFLSNFTNLQNDFMDKNLKDDNIEMVLLQNTGASGIKNIDYLKELIFHEDIYGPKQKKNNSYEVTLLNKEKLKMKRAMERLENLYLFDDSDMSEKDYILKKKQIIDKLDEIDKKLYSFNTSNEKAVDIKLPVKIEYDDKGFDYKYVLQYIGRKQLKDFVNTIINVIIVENRKVQSVTFKNGLEIFFSY